MTQPLRIIGADLADRYATAGGRYQQSYSTLEESCVVCGAPGVTCPGSAHQLPEAPVAGTRKTTDESSDKQDVTVSTTGGPELEVVPPSAAAGTYGDPNYGSVAVDDSKDPMVRLTEDVVEETVAPNTTTPTQVLRFAAGTTARKSAVQAVSKDAKFEKL